MYTPPLCSSAELPTKVQGVVHDGGGSACAHIEGPYDLGRIPAEDVVRKDVDPLHATFIGHADAAAGKGLPVFEDEPITVASSHPHRCRSLSF